MAPRKRVSDDDDEEYSNDFYRERHKQFHDRLLSERRYDESTKAILALIKKRWRPTMKATILCIFLMRDCLFFFFLPY